MPHPPLRPCTVPGCPQRTNGGRCANHQRAGPTRRREDRALYGPDWPRRRLDYLTRHPRCQRCGRLAHVADPHPEGIRSLRRRGAPDPHADHRLRPLCWPCHSQETGRREPGGWNTLYR